MASTWLRKSAGKDFPEAQSALGTMYTVGQGVPRDFVQAHMWLSSAFAHGDADAQKRLDSVAWRMSPNRDSRGATPCKGVETERQRLRLKEFRNFRFLIGRF